MRRALVVAGIAAAAALLAWILVRPASGPPEAGAAPPAEVRASAPRPAARTAMPAASAAPVAATRPPSPPPTPSASPSSGMRALDALDARLADYEEMSLEYDLPEGAPREEEDRLAIERLKAVSGEAARLQKAYEDVISLHDDPRAAVLAAIAIGDVQDALRVDLLDSPVMSYFTPKQAELYRLGLEDKASAVEVAAGEAWDRAAELAEAVPGDPEIEALLAERRAAAE